MVTTLLVIWAAITLVFVFIMGWKMLLGLHEEDVVILDAAEAKQAAEQQRIAAKLEKLVVWAKASGFASLALLVALIFAWAYKAFNGPSV